MGTFYRLACCLQDNQTRIRLLESEFSDSDCPVCLCFQAGKVTPFAQNAHLTFCIAAWIFYDPVLSPVTAIAAVTQGLTLLQGCLRRWAKNFQGCLRDGFGSVSTELFEQFLRSMPTIWPETASFRWSPKPTGRTRKFSHRGQQPVGM